MEESTAVANAIYFGIIGFVVLVILHWLTEPPRPDEPTRLALMRSWFMSRYFAQATPYEDEQDKDLYDVSPEERNNEGAENSTTEPKQARSASFPFPDTFAALAALVREGKLSEMDALRYGVGVSPGGSQKYKAARQALTAALAALAAPRFPPLTQEQIDQREQLGLNKKY